MAGSFDDTDDGLGGKKAVLKKTDILGAGWESRLEEARARRAKALEGKEQPEAAEAPKPWEAGSAAQLPPLIDEATGEAADAPDLSLLGLSPEEEPGLPEPPPQEEIEAAIAAARSARIEVQDTPGVARRDADVIPVAVPLKDENERATAKSVAGATPVPGLAALDELRPVRRQSWADRQREIEQENRMAVEEMRPETPAGEDADDDMVAVGGIRWGLVAAAAFLVAAPIAAYGYYKSDERVALVLRANLGGSDPAPLAVQPSILERVRVASIDPEVVSDAVDLSLPAGGQSVVNASRAPRGPRTPSLALVRVGLDPALQAPYIAEVSPEEAEAELWSRMAGLGPLGSDVRLAFGFDRTATPAPVLSEIAPRVASKVGRLSVVATFGNRAPPEAPGLLESRPAGTVDTLLAVKGPAPLDLLPTVPERLGRGPQPSHEWMRLLGDAARRASVALPGTLDLYLPVPPDRDARQPGSQSWEQALVVPNWDARSQTTFTTGETVAIFDTEPTRRDPFLPFDRAMVLSMLAPAPSLLAPPERLDQLVPVLSGPRVTPLPDPADVAPSTPDVTPGAVVFVHAAVSAEASEIEAARATVAGATGYATQTTPPFDFKISQTQVRYFHEADRDAAAAVAEATSARLRSFLNFDPKPEPGTVELWLAGGGKSGAAPAAPKVAKKKPAAPKRTASARTAPKRQVQNPPTKKIEATTIIRKRLSTFQKILGGSGG